jgi:hypothetical protein
VWGGHDGEIIGASTGTTGITDYDSGEAYTLDGSGDHVLVEDFPWPADSLSLSFWHELDNTNSNNALFETETSNPEMVIRVDTSNGYDILIDGVVSTNNGSESTGTPRFITVVADEPNGEFVLYRDASELFTVGSFSGFSSATIDFKIGSFYGALSSNDHYGGIIDGARIYDKALSSSEVSDLYNTGSIDG